MKTKKHVMPKDDLDKEKTKNQRRLSSQADFFSCFAFFVVGGMIYN
jgi:uncharacterized MAPEG superfamily protein